MATNIYSTIAAFLDANGVTVPYNIDTNMTFNQVSNLLTAVNNIEVEDDNEKEDIIDLVLDELDKKDRQRRKREANRTFARNVSLVTRRLPPDITRHTQEFGIEKTKGGKKSRRHKKHKKGRKTKRRRY